MLGLIQDGGWAMYPLIVLPVLGIAIAIEREADVGPFGNDTALQVATVFLLHRVEAVIGQ